MLLAGLDFETNGYHDDPDKEYITEIGISLWELFPDGKFCEIDRFSSLVQLPEKYEITSEVSFITKITKEKCEALGLPLMEAAKRMKELLDKADYIVAHNAKFEKEVIAGFNKNSQYLLKKWIDTITDIPYPEFCKERKLELLLNRFDLNDQVYCENSKEYLHSHRAYYDAFKMMQLLAQHNVERIVERANFPSIRICAAPAWIDHLPDGTEVLRAGGGKLPFSLKDRVKSDGISMWDPNYKKWHTYIKPEDFRVFKERAGKDYCVVFWPENPQQKEDFQQYIREHGIECLT